MKKLILFFLTILLSAVYSDIIAQTVQYSFDTSGNITSRKTITLRSAPLPSDSISMPDIFEDMEINIRIHPNPTQGELAIEIPDYEDNETLVFQLYDMNGRLLFNTEKTGSYINLDLSNYNNGIYILRLNRNGKDSTWRIVKTN